MLWVPAGAPMVHDSSMPSGTSAFYGTAPTLGLIDPDKKQTSPADYHAALIAAWGPALAPQVLAQYVTCGPLFSGVASPSLPVCVCVSGFAGPALSFARCGSLCGFSLSLCLAVSFLCPFLLAVCVCVCVPACLSVSHECGMTGACMHVHATA